MERLRTLRLIVYIICAILTLQLAMLVIIIKPSGIFLWGAFAVIAILCIYLSRVALVAIGELMDNENKNRQK